MGADSELSKTIKTGDVAGPDYLLTGKQAGRGTPIERIRILVAGEHSLLRGALSDVLQLSSDFEVVAEATCGEQTLDLAQRHRPDVLLLDVGLPDRDPLQTVRKLLATNPRLRVIVLSGRDDDRSTVLEMLDLGISGYLHKNVDRSVLLSAIRNVREGATHVTLSLARQASSDAYPAQPERTVDEPRSKVLSIREIEILDRVRLALSNRQIALRLGITEGTVKQHLRNIFTKLGAVSRMDAVNKAIDADVIPSFTAGHDSDRRVRSRAAGGF